MTLVDAYEAKHHAIELPDPIEAIKFRMEKKGLTRADLEPMIGSRARVSEVLNGRRPLTITMIKKLRDCLGIPADVTGRGRRPEGSQKVYRSYLTACHRRNNAVAIAKKPSSLMTETRPRR